MLAWDDSRLRGCRRIAEDVRPGSVVGCFECGMVHARSKDCRASPSQCRHDLVGHCDPKSRRSKCSHLAATGEAHKSPFKKPPQRPLFCPKSNFLHMNGRSEE